MSLTIPHAGVLEDLDTLPAYLAPDHSCTHPTTGRYSCGFCGVGDSGLVASDVIPDTGWDELPAGPIRVELASPGASGTLKGSLAEEGTITIETPEPLVAAGGVLSVRIVGVGDGEPHAVTLREIGCDKSLSGGMSAQRFVRYRRGGGITESRMEQVGPTRGCAKLLLSTVRQEPAFPIHVTPSVLDSSSSNGGRRAISYDEAIRRLADLVLDHLPPHGRTLLYACGQVDYFTIFAVQEVLRLLGVRNLTGNAEHCLNAGAVHNERLTGQEGPFVTIEQGLRGEGDRCYLLNGWNGYVTHPPAFHELLQRPDLDAYLVEVQVTESAKALAERLGPDHVLLVRPRTDPMLAMAVIHEILTQHAEAIDHRFIDRFADRESFDSLRARAMAPEFSAEYVASRIAPEPAYVDRLVKGIRRIARTFARPGSVPVNIPSVGLSQTSGVVAHCLWGCALALVGKYGLRADGSLAGGTLRLPGQINAQSEVQGLSRNVFMGRIRMDNHADAARRMGLDDDAYAHVLEDEPRAALDYANTADRPELFLFVGTQFEANMMQRRRWLEKLAEPNVRFVVIDPIPDPYTEAHAELIIPSPPHPATTKLYQNGEWRLSLGIPHKRAAPETRSDATILYDLMAEITARVERDEAVAQAHPVLARHAETGYLRDRFCEPGLPRLEGEVSRPHLWERVQAYMGGGSGPLYCRPEHADGTPIAWQELLAGSVIYGGVGTTRFRLDYDREDAQPFADVYRRPTRFQFFTPTEEDLHFPDGVILNSGRSSLSDDRAAVQFATNSFNSGKATPLVGMPDEQPLFVSPALAKRHGLRTGDSARVTSRDTGDAIVVPVVVSDRVKGDTTYMSFHKSRAQLERGLYVNDVTEQRGRCPYSSQTSVKATEVVIERVAPLRLDPSTFDPTQELPLWSGQQTPLHVTDILHETHDVVTFRFQGDPLCRYVYLPGQFLSLVLNIDGKKVVRSYSISSTPTRPYVLEITVKRVPGGLVSNWLIDNLKPGDRIEAAGPRGNFCLRPGQIPRKMLFLGAGSGVTPLMSMARWLCDVSADVDVLFFNSVKTSQDNVFGTELEMLSSRYRMFSPVVTTTTRERARTVTMIGRISRAMLETIAPDLHERQVFMCGPEPFAEAARAILTDMGFDLKNLHSESFGGVRTSVVDKPAPIGSHAKAAEDGVAVGTLSVSFARSGKSLRTDGQATLLDLAEASDVDMDYACRMGSCGVCRARLLDGDVEMPQGIALSPEERAEGYVLTCVSSPRTSCTLDA